MLLTVHALTGIALGSVIDQPLVGFPVGVLSHLALDATPHANWEPVPFVLTYKQRPDPLGMVAFRRPVYFLIGCLDVAGATTVLGVGLFIMPHRTPTVAAAWLGAVAPDLLYIPEIFFGKRLLPAFKRFHHAIQWSQSPYGIPIELAYALVLLHYLHLV